MNEPIPSKPQKAFYTIQNDIYHYYTGYLSNGNQVLLNSDGSEEDTPVFPLVEFDKDGNFLAIHTKETGNPGFNPLLFTPATILVKQFFIPDHWIGIKDLPEHYQEFLDHPENANEDERFYYPEEIEGWRASGEFVLWFNEDYFLNEDGELDSF